ncbi:MAG: NUDIX hydrolase [Lentisphaerae bacterium]|nr:NUDIX hydrolase [Lentisphaerota bacterium]
MAAATVAAVILGSEGPGRSVLLTRRNVEPFKGAWCLPGGHIDPYEEAETAVVREVKEETGLRFTGEFLRCFDEIYPDMGIHNVVLVFQGKAEGTLRPCETEVSEIRWFPLSEAIALPLAFCHASVIRSATCRPRPS